MFHVSNIEKSSATQFVSGKVIERSDLSEDQVDVFDSVITWYKDPNARQYLKLGGYAGTGKTTLVAALAKVLEANDEMIAYCAFTGKAVNVMSKKLKAAGVAGWCGTLHSLMYRPKTDDNGKVLTWEKTDALPFSFIVVDEASMVGKELWEDLISYGLPVLAVGDHGQLPPVGDSVVNLMASPDLRLEHIHRQAEGNPILSLAQWVREGKTHLKFEPTDNRVSFVPSIASISDKLQDPLNSCALCYTNRTRASLNKYLRGVQFKYSGTMPKEGDTVICLKNKKPIFNGMRGILTQANSNYDDLDRFTGTITFPDDNLKLEAHIYFPQFGAIKTLDDLAPLKLKYKRDSLSWDSLGMLFDFGYAMTCHKAQGSQFKDVAIVWENLFRDNDTRARWMYTAVTRASENLYIVRP